MLKLKNFYLALMHVSSVHIMTTGVSVNIRGVGAKTFTDTEDVEKIMTALDELCEEYECERIQKSAAEEADKFAQMMETLTAEVEGAETDAANAKKGFELATEQARKEAEKAKIDVEDAKKYLEELKAEIQSLLKTPAEDAVIDNGAGVTEAQARKAKRPK